MPTINNTKNKGAWANRWEKLICSIEDQETHEEVNAIDENYEKITITVDSGAADTVGPKHVAQGIPIRPTKASREGSTTRQQMEHKLRITDKRGLRVLTTKELKPESPFRLLKYTRH